MKFTYPIFANLAPSLKGLLEGLGHEVVLEEHNDESLRLGVKYAPELMCFPFKLELGHTLYMLGKYKDIDSYAVFSQSHPCRICAYGPLFETIIKERFANVTVHNWNYSKFMKLMRQVKNTSEKDISWLQFSRLVALSIRKLTLLDRLERSLLKVRAAEKKPNATESYYRAGSTAISEQATFESVNRVYKHYHRAMLDNWDRNNRTALKILIVGEMDAQTNQFLNFNMQKKLNALNVEVERNFWLSQIINEFFHVKGFCGKDDLPSTKEIFKAGERYLEGGVGAEFTVGATVLYAKQNYDGIIHIMPFACVLETTASMAIRRISREYDMPVLTLIIDEQTGEAGVVTRLEAFVDLIRQKRARGSGIPPAAQRKTLQNRKGEKEIWPLGYS